MPLSSFADPYFGPEDLTCRVLLFQSKNPVFCHFPILQSSFTIESCMKRLTSIVTNIFVAIYKQLVMLFQGISQTKPTFDSPFRRNTAFSKPISETWDPENVKPYEHDHVPNM